MKQFTILGDYELNQCVELDNIIDADQYYIEIKLNSGHDITMSIDDFDIFIYPLYNPNKVVVGIPEAISLTGNSKVERRTLSNGNTGIFYHKVLKDLELSYGDRYLIGVKKPFKSTPSHNNHYLEIQTTPIGSSRKTSKTIFINSSSSSDRPIIYANSHIFQTNEDDSTRVEVTIDAPYTTEDNGYFYKYTGPDIIDANTGYTGLTGYSAYSDEVEITNEYTAVGYLFGTKDNFYTYTNEASNGKLNFTITDSNPNSAYLYLATYTPKLLLSNLGVFADMKPFMNSQEDEGFKILFKRVNSSGTNYGSSTDNLSILYHTEFIDKNGNILNKNHKVFNLPANLAYKETDLIPWVENSSDCKLVIDKVTCSGSPTKIAGAYKKYYWMKNDDGLTKLFLYSTNTSWSGNSMRLNFYYDGGSFQSPDPANLPVTPILMDTLEITSFNLPLKLSFTADGTDSDNIDGYAYFDITKDSETGEVVDQFSVSASDNTGAVSNFLVEEGVKYYVDCHASVPGETVLVIMESPGITSRSFYYRFQLIGSSYPIGYRIPFKTVQYNENRDVIYESIDSEGSTSSSSSYISSKLTNWVTNAKYATVYPVSKGFVEGYKIYGLTDTTSYHIQRPTYLTTVKFGNFTGQYGQFYLTKNAVYGSHTSDQLIMAGGFSAHSGGSFTLDEGRVSSGDALYLKILNSNSKYVKARWIYMMSGGGTVNGNWMTASYVSTSYATIIKNVTEAMLESNNFTIEIEPI